MATDTTPSQPVDDSDELDDAVTSTVLPRDAWDPSQDVIQLPAADCRERALPIRPGDLTRLLMADETLTDEERRYLGQFCRLLGATFHHEFYERLRELKERYAPYDPDSDYVPMPEFSPSPEDHPPENFLELFETTLERANFHQLNIDIIHAAIAAPNEHGLNYVPNFSLFEQMRIYVRGYTRITREARTARTKFRKKMVVLDAYQRLIVALKFKSDAPRLGPNVRTDVLYLRMFKDVPHVDMEMHLPEQGTKVRMRLLDKAQIASPLAVGIPTMIFKALGAVTMTGMAGLVVAPISAGMNSFFGFQRAKQKHMNHMIRTLYYMTLANNASVLTRLIDSAEEEEYKETLLAYFFLWRSGDQQGKALTQVELDAFLERFLKDKVGLEVNFDMNDALSKLFRLGLIRRDSAGKIYPTPIEQALVHLDRLWDNTFHFIDAKARSRPGN